MNKRILYAGIISLALAMIFSACPPVPDPVPDPDPGPGLTPNPSPDPNPDPITYPITVTDSNLNQMKSLIAAAAAAGGGTSKTNPIIVTITISDASLLSGTNSEDIDPLHKLFDAIPSAKYVSYDLSDCIFTDLEGVTFDIAFARTNSAYLASIILPETLISIGDSAFSGCSRLTEIIIPNSVTSIGSDAFYGCSGLTSVTIPNSVESIGSAAFGICSGLTEIIIPNSVNSIGDWVFDSCSGLESVSIGNSVISIGDYAFRNCSGLTEITIPDSVTSIGISAFYGCSGLASVSIGNSVTSIERGAFYGCSGLTSIEVNESNASYKDIDGVLFNKAGTTLLLYPNGKGAIYTIPDSVTSIDISAFSGCSGLTSIQVSGDNTSYTSIDGVLFNKAGTTLIRYPEGKEGTYIISDSVTSIGERAFQYCSKLESVIIGNSVTSIGDYTFQQCSKLESVIIGNSVTSIGNWAFAYCSGLTSVYVLKDTLPLTSLVAGAFFSTYPLKIYVPADRVTDYKVAGSWSSYKDKIQAAP